MPLQGRGKVTLKQYFFKPVTKMLVALLFILCIGLESVASFNKNHAHPHQGVLEPYTGKPLPVDLTVTQEQKLNNGESVIYYKIYISYMIFCS
jgi:hypothetical protein